jgi:hypothetical protein
MGNEGRIESPPSTTGAAIPDIFHNIFFFSERSNLKDDIRIDNTTSVKVAKVSTGY